MNSGRTIFSQIMDCLPAYEFRQCVEQYSGNYKIMTLNQMDVIAINEAFAAVVLVICRSIPGMSKEEMFKKVNVNGGAIAFGHPIGATGARIAMTLGYELKRRGGGYGVCVFAQDMRRGMRC